MTVSRRILTVGALMVLAAWVPARAAHAYTANAHVAAFVEVFASGAPAEVDCPDSPEEWQLMTGAEVPDNMYGRTDIRRQVVSFRPDLCPILDNLALSDADNRTKALAVLVLVHESYHVRHWAWRLDEARVECQAIRHFRAGVRILGGSAALADRLLPFGLAWHNWITENRLFFRSSCRLPQLPTVPVESVSTSR